MVNTKADNGQDTNNSKSNSNSNYNSNPKGNSNSNPNFEEKLKILQLKQVTEHFKYGWAIKGRRGRLAYFGYELVIGILAVSACFLGLGVILLFVDTKAFPLEQQHALGLAIGYLATTRPHITNIGRRLHDLNLSGIWAYVIFLGGGILWYVPWGAYFLFLLELYLSFWPGTEGSNKYGDRGD